MTEEDRQKLRVPFWCPQCNGPMKGKSTSMFYRYGCCMVCFIEFIDGREQKWKDGWRPSPEDMKRFEEKYNKSPYRDSNLPEI